ncbi:hypothetical protein LguiA_016965 [Lonicera macranthoides]
MVLGPKSTNRKVTSVKVDYLIHLVEIKPWPPSQSLRSIRSALIQWEHGEKNSGSTNPVVPSLGSGSGIGDGKIEFNESFKLPVMLLRELSIKGGDGDTFQKNCLVFNLYEPRRDKTVKGQSLGTTIVDLADYGIVKETLSLSAPMNCKRAFSNTAQPLLFFKIQPVEKGRTRSLSRDILSREASMDTNGSESVSAFVNGDYAEEAEVGSFTDDDVSSHSSVAVSYSTLESNGGSPPNKEIASEVMKDCPGDAKDQYISNSAQRLVKSDVENIDIVTTSSDFCDRSVMSIPKKIGAHSITDSNENCSSDDGNQNKRQESQFLEERSHCIEDESLNTFSQDNTREKVSSGNYAPSVSRENLGANGYILNMDRLKHVKSVRSPMDLIRSNGSFRSNQSVDKVNDDGVTKSAQNGIGNERKDAKIYPKETTNISSENKMQQLESRIKMLERELREAAAIEVSLYSVVAEHGSSINKVHAPARRLSRLYLYACKECSQSRRASAARSAVSGLVLVAKACGNDVPRLTFWLSNSVMLRAIIHQAFEEQQLRLSVGSFVERDGVGKANKEKSSLLKWKESPSRKETRSILHGSFNDWEDPRKFTSALEKIESWIFSRIVESIWWQSFTPYMQSAAAKATTRTKGSGSSEVYERASSFGEQEQANFSLELWKKAFRDTCERICPVQAGGHECGCLPILSRLIMEQCVARLDVAMFNAILRESADEIPTDPVSDPISDANVLPIPAGKASFGAGAQLKNSIGNWSRWLTDLFGLDDADPLDDGNEPHNDDDSEIKENDAFFKSFHLLNALSDLMMLPKDMLLSSSIRKEVCPTFGAPLIKRILNNFVPDEFCPDPIPDAVLEALDSEEPFETREDSVTNFPCTAAPIVYLPPSGDLLAKIVGESGSKSQLRRSGSSIIRKSYTSDDELDELDSPLTSIIGTSRMQATPTKPNRTSNRRQSAIRYQLLREVWINSV